MIWKKVMSGSFASKLVGGAGPVVYYSEVQDWGLQLTDLFGDLVIRGRGTANVKVTVKIFSGPEADLNTFLVAPTGTMATAVPGLASWALPQAIALTPILSFPRPFFRVELTVDSTAPEDHAELDIWLGGKAY